MRLVLYINRIGALFVILVIVLCQRTWCQQRYFTGDNTNEGEFNKILKSAQRAQRDVDDLPPAYSIKQYAPLPQNQGKQGTCVAWSTGYAARTISYCIRHQITNPKEINQYAFSPYFLYYYIKANGDNECVLGAKIEPALKILSDKGDVPFSEPVQACAAIIDSSKNLIAKTYAIKAYTSLTNIFGGISKNEILSIKKSIAEKLPVIFSIKCFTSLFNVDSSGRWMVPAVDTAANNHALCIVGYDDRKFNGAFEIMNSWGPDWGNHGFFWLTYDQVMRYGTYALQLMDKEVYDPAVLRGMDPPAIKGAVDFVLTDENGADLSVMKVRKAVVDTGLTMAAHYQLDGNYPGGTMFKVKFTANAPAFVYIFAFDDQRNFSTMFPYAENISPVINSSKASIYLPSERKHFRLNADASHDRIYVIFSKSEIDLNSFKNAVLSGTGSPERVLAERFKDRLLSSNNAKFGGDQVSFVVPALEEQLVAFYIDLYHQ